MKEKGLRGKECLKHYVRLMPSMPGVYRMLDEYARVLYVGKARHLQKRLQSHARNDAHSPQLSWFLEQVATVDFIVTKTEGEAQILESDMIKNDSPMANVLMTDGKTHPYLLLTGGDIPRMMVFRETQNLSSLSAMGGRLFGPFSSTTSVEHIIRTLQTSFRLRVCSDSVYHGRKRPCLLYQINRCSAPCMGLISLKDYQKNVLEACSSMDNQAHQKHFLKNLTRQVEDATQSQFHELARQYRNRLRSLHKSLMSRSVRAKTFKNANILAVEEKEGYCCIQWFSFRNGRPSGHQYFLPQVKNGDHLAKILENFLFVFIKPTHMPIFYVNLPLPKDVALRLSAKLRRKVRISHPLRGEKKMLVDLAYVNARVVLNKMYGKF